MFHIDNAQPDSAQITFDDGYDRAEIRRHGFATPDRKGGVFFHNPDDLSPEHCTTDKEWQSMINLINAAPDLLRFVIEYRHEARKLGWGCSSLDDMATAVIDKIEEGN